MIKSAVTISLVPSLRGGPWILWDDLPTSCRKATELGFDGVELFTEGPAAEGLDSILRETGLGLAAVGTGAGKVSEAAGCAACATRSGADALTRRSCPL